MPRRNHHPIVNIIRCAPPDRVRATLDLRQGSRTARIANPKRVASRSGCRGVHLTRALREQ